MSFWNDLKKSGQEAAGKAKDLAEVTRLQLVQKEQERKLEKLYGQLGKACYDAAVPGRTVPFPSSSAPSHKPWKRSSRPRSSSGC